MAKKKPARKAVAKAEPQNGTESGGSGTAKYPRHSVDKSLRIPKAILEQHAGRECTDTEAAKFCGLKSAAGPFSVEISSAIKYGFLERPSSKRVTVTDLAKKAIRPQTEGDRIDAFRDAVLKAPGISNVYSHYRGENLPDSPFFENALADTFKIPQSKIPEFKNIFLESMTAAKLADVHDDGKIRILDVSKDGESLAVAGSTHKPTASTKISTDDKCFVMMPFSDPIGGYYKLIYEPAVKQAGLDPVRADASIFGTGKIMDQIWEGINSARVLVAELTTKNPNVFYELGLAHALKKPVVLVSSNESDVPFDLKHIRVIYYDQSDPFWGKKLLDKVAENIVSAINNPAEAIFQGNVVDLLTT